MKIFTHSPYIVIWIKLYTKIHLFDRKAFAAGIISVGGGMASRLYRVFLTMFGKKIQLNSNIFFYIKGKVSIIHKQTKKHFHLSEQFIFYIHFLLERRNQHRAREILSLISELKRSQLYYTYFHQLDKKNKYTLQRKMFQVCAWDVRGSLFIPSDASWIFE